MHTFYTHTHRDRDQNNSIFTCFPEVWEILSSSSRASPHLCTTALALSISAQAKDLSWLTNFLASSEACKERRDWVFPLAQKQDKWKKKI